MTLLALQRDFHRWLAEESPAAAARLGAGARAAPGLSVYLNNYRGQLMAVLGDTYATLRAWLGATAFDRVAALHIERCPPHHWTIDAYALEFPRTLARLHPEAPEAVELAQLECALAVAFVGRDADALDRSTLADIDWDRARFTLVPTFALLPARTNAGAIWSAIAAGDTPPAAKALSAPASIAVWRAGDSPSFRTLEATEAQALSLLADGRTFGAACECFVDVLGEEQGGTAAGHALARWLEDGMIVAIDG